MPSISRRDFVKYSASAVAAVAARTCAGAAAKGETRQKHPNLVFVFPDQMRGQAIGFLDEDPDATPHLDRFAGQSLVLPEAVSNYPVCSPFRAMLMTGKFPHANGVISNCNSQTAPFGCELDESDRCWSDVLKGKGYSLGYIGKWHLDSPHKPYVKCKNNSEKFAWNEWCPPDRRHGFDFWLAYGTYDFHMNPMYWSTDAARDEFAFVEQWGPEFEADTAIKYIKNEDGTYRDPSRPFALVVSMNPPHTPYNQFPERYLEPYEGKTSKDLIVRPNVDTSGQTAMSRLALTHTKNYFGNVTGVDHQFGRIVQALAEAGLEDDTIVIFTSDHGNCVGTHNQDTKNNIYEESMRVPFLIRWPGKIEPRRDDLLISTTDIYPSLLELMGHKADVPAQVEGTSHAQLFLTGEGRRPGSQPYLKIPYDNRAYGWRGVRTHEWKLTINCVPDKPIETVLFDRRNDPYELKNLAPEKPEVVRELITAELIPWLKRSGDPWKGV